MKKLLIVVDFQNDFIDGSLGFSKATTLVDKINKKINEYLDNDDEIPEISCDAKRMRQVFLNILDNAAKHGSEGKKIEASVTCNADAVIFQIRDYGSGIPEDEIPLVKKKFYKGSSKARGSGIGLAVCDEIVVLHGGSLILSNAEGGGTMVTIELPISQ